MWVPPPRKKPLPVRIDSAWAPLSPQDEWKAFAQAQAPILVEADWVQRCTFRGTEVVAETAEIGREYINNTFKVGFSCNPRGKVWVEGGMSCGGIASAYKFDGAGRFLDSKGKCIFLIAAEGFDLTSVDSQNRCFEIMSFRVIGSRVIAGAWVSGVDEEQGMLISTNVEGFCLNPNFRRPFWLGAAELSKKLKKFVGQLGGKKSLKLDEEELKVWCHRLGVLPPDL